MKGDIFADYWDMIKSVDGRKNESNARSSAGETEAAKN